MSEELEKVARAMCIADGYNPEGQSVGDQWNGGWLDWRTYIGKAQAAIAALDEARKLGKVGE